MRALFLFGLGVLVPTSEAKVSEQTKIATDVFGYRATIEVSSHLPPSRGNDYDVENLIDGDIKTAWIEGVDGMGQGEFINVTFAGQTPVYGIKFIPGYSKSKTTLATNAFPLFEVTFGGIVLKPRAALLEYAYEVVRKGALQGEPYKVPTDQPEHFESRYIVLPAPVETTSLKIRITDTLAQVGVAPDSGFSELSVITDKVLAGDPIAKALLNLQKTPAADFKPSLSKPSLQQCKLPHSPKQKEKFAALSVSDVLTMVKGSLPDVRRKPQNPHMEAVHTQRQKKGFSLIFATNATEACSSDGEGGTYYFPSLNYEGGNLRSISFVAREHPVP